MRGEPRNAFPRPPRSNFLLKMGQPSMRLKEGKAGAEVARVLAILNGEPVEPEHSEGERNPMNREQRRRTIVEGATKLSVGNLPYEMDSADLRALFEPTGQVTDCKVFRDQDSRSKGYGLVRIIGPIDAALALNESECAGRRMRVRLWVE
jgi:RNA recognition motif-containing protein